MKRLYLLFLLSTMGMLTSYAQHTKKHKVQQKTAVTQPIQAKPSGVKEQKQAPAKGAHQSVKTQPIPMKGQQVPAKGHQLPVKGQHPMPVKGYQAVPAKGHQPTLVKGQQPAQVPAKQPLHGKLNPRNAHGAKRGAKSPGYVTTDEIKGLQQQNQKLQNEIKEHEEEMKVKQKDVDTRLEKIVRLDTEIGQHQRTIDTIATDIKGLDSNIGILKGQLASLEAQLGERRTRFIRSMRYMARHRSIQDKLMFIFSANSLTQMYRRLRFVREYAAYQRAQGELIKAKQQQIDQKHSQLKEVRVDKSTLLYKDKKIHAQMEQKRVEQQTVVASLQQDQKVLEGVIAQRRQQQQALNAQIDRLIQVEIQQPRARA